MNPGAFRTNFLGEMQFSSNPLPKDYKTGVVGQTMSRFTDAAGKQVGDPDKAIERIFEFVVGEGMAGELALKMKEGKDGDRALRLVLGEDALTRMKRNNDKFVGDFTIGEKVALSTGF